MNTKIYSHPGQPEMQVEVILASVGKDAPPLYTIRMRYPRIIHAEIMTHRVFSRNARSSRAVPVKTMLEEIRTRPFVPWHWGKNQKGMQATEECNVLVTLEDIAHFDTGLDWTTFDYTRERAWLWARDKSFETAEAFDTAGYHKQIVNRLIEPFSWIDTLITATEWKNFLWLRQHKDAEPHLQDLANLVAQAIEETTPQQLEPGEWHLPYINEEDLEESAHLMASDRDFLCRISAARCARISYKPFDGNASYERELERYNYLVGSDRVHASPLEHQATPDVIVQYLHGGQVWGEPRLHGNLRGWIQHRKLVEGEYVKG